MYLGNQIRADTHLPIPTGKKPAPQGQYRGPDKLRAARALSLGVLLSLLLWALLYGMWTLVARL